MMISTTRTGLNHGYSQMQFFMWLILSVVSGVSELIRGKRIGAWGLQLKKGILDWGQEIVASHGFLERYSWPVDGRMAMWRFKATMGVI